jgi:predicted NAD/FAD-binding protein
VCEADVEAVLGPDGESAEVHRRAHAHESFDHVVLATQANQAHDLWQRSPAEVRELLAAFQYRPLEVVMHRDARLMPLRRRDWSPVNARVSAEHDRPETTIWVNAVQPALRRAPAVFQTVHPQREPREELVISRARFERPLVDTSSQRALARLQALQPQLGRSSHVWLCGSYADTGVPLLESAVRSAYAVAESLDGLCAASST